jgi:hypothetical protein
MLQKNDDAFEFASSTGSQLCTNVDSFNPGYPYLLQIPSVHQPGMESRLLGINAEQSNWTIQNSPTPEDTKNECIALVRKVQPTYGSSAREIRDERRPQCHTVEQPSPSS